MKKLFIILILPLVFSVCTKKWDIVPGTISIIVKNATGDNLLDPDFEGNILDNEIYVEYDGETYTLDENAVETRAIPAIWYGLRYAEAAKRLWFGQFSTGADYRGEIFTINWGDGTSDEIKFDLFTRGSHNVKKKIWLNGELQSENDLVVTIVK